MGLLANRRIKEVNLRGNDVREEGGEMLAAMLVQNKCLEVLNLSVNAIGDRTGIAFSEVLAVTSEYGLANSTLRRLDLTGNYNLTAKASKLLRDAQEGRRWSWPKEKLILTASHQPGNLFARLEPELVEAVLVRCRQGLDILLQAEAVPGPLSHPAEVSL